MESGNAERGQATGRTRARLVERAPWIVAFALVASFLLAAWLSGTAPTTRSLGNLEKVRVTQPYRAGEVTWEVLRAHLRPSTTEGETDLLVDVRVTNHSGRTMPLGKVYYEQEPFEFPVLTWTGRRQASWERGAFDSFWLPGASYSSHNYVVGAGLTFEISPTLAMGVLEEDIVGLPVRVFLPRMDLTYTRSETSGYLWEIPHVVAYVDVEIEAAP
ncbi:MAG: hypothetical protein Q4G64_03210 [bacterium]|nr:hypothetical protein [bacterium]